MINQTAGQCFQIKSRLLLGSQQDNLDMEFLFKMKKPQITVFWQEQGRAGPQQNVVFCPPAGLAGGGGCGCYLWLE